MKTTYYKYPSNCLYILFSNRNKITVNLYDFDTGIQISTINIKKLDIPNDMIECCKLEFDKAFNLALALISNKSLNK